LTSIQIRLITNLEINSTLFLPQLQRKKNPGIFRERVGGKIYIPGLFTPFIFPHIFTRNPKGYKK
jgi:hypothetical protein